MKKLALIILILSLLCSGLLIGCNNTDDDYDNEDEENEKNDNDKDENEELTPNEKKIKTFTEFLVANEYAKAIEYYQDELWGNYELESSAEDEIIVFGQNVNAKILSGEYTEKQANAQLVVIERVIEGIDVYPEDYDDMLMAIKLSFWSKEAFSTAQSFENEKKYIDAFIEYKKVIENDCNYPVAQEGAQRCLNTYKTELFTEVEELIDKEDYVSAIKILQLAESRVPNDSEISAKLMDCEETYVGIVLKEADLLFVTPATDYDKALTVIDTALQTCPNNKELNTQKTYYSSFIPVNLYDVEPIKGGLNTDEFDIDTYKHAHQNCFTSGGSFDYPNSAVYHLDSKYNKFSATIYGRSDDVEGEVCLLVLDADGVIIYENYEILDNAKAWRIELDITGVSELTIFMGAEYYSSGYGMTEVTVQRTVE